MFEFTVAIRYLIPKRKSLSTALVALLSIVVISLVVWLILVFLSVTTGIEKNWLNKLTSLHAPIRLTPTDHYYRSYYYRSDAIAAQSNYSLKTIGEKAKSITSEPFSSATDEQIPSHWPLPDRHKSGALVDPVKEVVTFLNRLELTFQDYEISGALLRLNLKDQNGLPATLSQMSFLHTFMDKNPKWATLLLPPTSDDINALLQSTLHQSEKRQSILQNIEISKVAIQDLDGSLALEGSQFIAFTQIGETNEVLIPTEKPASIFPNWERGIVTRINNQWRFRSDLGREIEKPHVRLISPLYITAFYHDGKIEVKGTLQNQPISGLLSLNQVTLHEIKPKWVFDALPSLPPPWVYIVNDRLVLPPSSSEYPALLPKSYRDSQARIGDHGTLGFTTAGSTSAQEQRLPIEVAGFYDPGLFSIGGKCIIVPGTITSVIHASNQTFSPDGTPTNGFSIWCDFNDVDHIQKTIQTELENANLQSYWKVATYKDYEFSKELFLQFQSDRNLFLLIALLILLVACCNIISLLVLLVNDKKREIAILRAMGASQKSIAAIFGICGWAMGIIGCIIGTFAAIYTLNNLNTIVYFLSAWQGHAAFQPAFFGNTLPSDLSKDAIVFVFIVTPLLSFLAGLVPAIRATRMHPTAALRQE